MEWKDRKDQTDARDREALDVWYEDRGSRDMTYARSIGQPLPPLPVPGHANCRVPNCYGYTRNGRYCVDHFPRCVS